MKIIQQIATNSDCYKAGYKITVKGLMLHSVGCNQPNPQVFANHWKNSNDVCCHGVLGADGTVIQTLPWNHRGWHCGASANSTHIGVEMTEPASIRYTGGSNFVDNDLVATKKFVIGTYKTAVELFAYLAKMYNLNPLEDGVIISHSEGYKRGVASGHADVEHIWNKYGLTMKQFRFDVRAAMYGAAVSQPSEPETLSLPPEYEELYRVRKSWSDASSQIGAYTSLDRAKKVCKEGYKIYNRNGNLIYPIADSNVVKADNFKVKVTVDELNVRCGAGVDFNAVGVIADKGVYTIVGISGNWGKLKSGAGWICLDYTERI